VWVQNLVLDRANGLSSLVASLSTVVELLKGRVDATAATGVRWGTWSVLVPTLLHFPELGPKLELLGSGRNADLMLD
jgi:hypothetical protein